MMLNEIKQITKELLANNINALNELLANTINALNELFKLSFNVIKRYKRINDIKRKRTILNELVTNIIST